MTIPTTLVDNNKLKVDLGTDNDVVVSSGDITETNLTALSKEEDTAHSSGDKGVMVLTVRHDDVTPMTSQAGDYQPLCTNEHGVLRTQAQQHIDIDECSATAGWSVLGNDTVNLATTTNHVYGSVALEFDKVDGVANTVFAGIQKTISSLDLAPYHKGGGFFLWSLYVSDITNIDYLFLRLGTDSSNYNEFRIFDEGIIAGWISARASIATPATVVGNGWDSEALTYVSVGVAFDLQNHTLADIAVDHISANTGLQTSSDISAEVSSSVSTPNVNLLKVGNTATTTGSGNVGAGSQRVTIATDDINLAAINANLGTIDTDTGVIAGDTTSIDGKITTCNTGNVTIGAAIPAGTNLVGKVGIDQTTPGTTNNVYVTTVKPDGTNTMPSLDAVGRAGFIKITDGTETASVGSNGNLQVSTPISTLVLTGGVGVTEDTQMEGMYYTTTPTSDVQYFYLPENATNAQEVINILFAMKKDDAQTLSIEFQALQQGAANWQPIPAYSTGTYAGDGTSENINSAFPLRHVIAAGNQYRIAATVGGSCTVGVQVMGAVL